MKNRFQNICHIYFPDLYLPSNYDKLISNQLKKVIKCFANDGNYYFNLNREFGENLTESELVKCRFEIPNFFSSNGLFIDKTMETFKEKKFFDPRISAIGMLKMNKKSYDMLPNICLYYLETTFFKPFSKITWDKYVNSYKKYNMKGLETFVELEYTNCVFSYSEGLHICFGMKQYNLDIILNSLNSLGYKIQKIYSDKLVIKAYL